MDEDEDALGRADETCLRASSDKLEDNVSESSMELEEEGTSVVAIVTLPSMSVEEAALLVVTMVPVAREDDAAREDVAPEPPVMVTVTVWPAVPLHTDPVGSTETELERNVVTPVASEDDGITVSVASEDVGSTVAVATDEVTKVEVTAEEVL